MANKVDTNTTSNKKLPQYIAALSVCLGSVAAGTVLGWTSNISEKLKQSSLNHIVVDDNILGWISSVMNLGAMLMCFPIGYLCDLIGRKWACLIQIVPFSIGWLLIIFATNEGMLYGGRFLTGLASGSFCVAAPIYSSEVAEKDIRGALGSYFQLLLTVGILIANVGGGFMEPQYLSILSACLPLVFGAVFFFQPETPLYLLKKHKYDQAIQSLRRLRGHDNVNQELDEIKHQIEAEEEQQIPFLKSLQTTASKKAIFICFGLMFFQQMSGVNAVIFFTGTIFASAGGTINDRDGTIYVGVVQVVATFISSVIVDRFGRKILLIVSAVCMAIAGLALGIYFTLRDILDNDSLNNIGFLPLVSLIIFISAFSLGFGPIPWLASAEIMPPEIKSVATSAAATFNWFLAFIVTRFYNNLTEAIGVDITFYIFAVISILGALFVVIFIPETKGKTIQEVQAILVKKKGENGKKDGIENPAFIN